MTTIYELAKITGFSPSTISRALSDKGYCSPKTKEIIRLAAQESNYIPSAAGRALKSMQTKRILFCIPDILNPFYFEMIRGTTDILDQHGYYSMLCYTQHKLSEEMKFLQLLAEQYGDGMIMVSFNFNETNIEAINRSPFPVVITNSYRKPLDKINFDAVYVDHTRAMYLATEHLIELGHRQIAVVIGDLREQTSIERAMGFRQCMEDFKIPYDEGNFITGDYSKMSGEMAAIRLLEMDRDFTAIVSANDLMAMGIISVFAERNIIIPDRYSLISLDNTDYAQTVNPPLTSVNMKQYKIGARSAELLIERIQGVRVDPVTECIEPQLILRRSCRPIEVS